MSVKLATVGLSIPPSTSLAAYTQAIPSSRWRHLPSTSTSAAPARPNHGRNLNLNPHPLLYQPSLHHGGGGHRGPKVIAQEGPDVREVGAVGENVAGADDVGGGCAGGGEGLCDCREGVFRLGLYVGREGAGLGVVAGGVSGWLGSSGRGLRDTGMRVKTGRERKVRRGWEVR